MDISNSEISQIKNKLEIILSKFDKVKLQNDKLEIEEQLQDKEVWKSPNGATKLNKELNSIINKLNILDEAEKKSIDLTVLYDLINDKSTGIKDKNEFETEIYSILKWADEKSIFFYLNGAYDSKDAIISIKSGQGGDDAEDWVGMLYRMYTKYFNKMGIKLEIIDEIKGDIAGYKYVSFQVSKEYAYGLYKNESGIHRLVRVSPFKSADRRDTSFASVEVMPVFEDIELDSVIINNEDIEFKAVYGSGPGGQSVNTTASAVRIVHKPTGITVSCSTLKSQQQNKERALQILKSKIYTIQIEKQNDKINDLKKDFKRPQWGNQVRNYILNPYKLVKDLRTGIESSNVNAILDGDIDEFINAGILI